MSVLAAISTHEKSNSVASKGLGEQLKAIYGRISRQYPFLSCIGVAATGKGNQGIQLYSSSCGAISSCEFPEVFNLESSRNAPLIVKDMTDFPGSREGKLPSPSIQSGLSLPLVADDETFGYTFFAAKEKDCFTPEIIGQMNVYARVIAQLLADDRHSTEEDLRSAVASILQLNNVNESESPAHLRRVAQYSRLIALECAPRYQLSASWIEHLCMFAPLHDIGKVFVPEGVLMKPGKLTDEEFEQVKTHTLKGREIIDHMIKCFDYNNDLHYTDMLRNIITYHHEAMDGSGYPYGLKGEDIPLEARIVAVADVLDALLTKRAYKDAWPMDKAMETMRQLAGSRLDPEFIEILSRNHEELLQIRIQCAQE
jgi:HD-GYP domain-containing protein (c-di-GMP phosphodiesterase class II)